MLNELLDIESDGKHKNLSDHAMHAIFFIKLFIPEPIYQFIIPNPQNGLSRFFAQALEDGENKRAKNE